MKKILLSICAFLLSATLVFAQTTATNFAATDCNSNAHSLFTELDNGKIIVLVWIMPCGTCINDALGAYNAVQSFAAANPGKVLYYLIDDLGDAGCSTLSGWATTNGIDVSKITIFSNSGNTIKESDFGGGGMPHVAIIGGIDHKIYLNILDGSNNETAFKNAINSAITTKVLPLEKKKANISVYPNPAKNNISIHYRLDNEEEIEISVFNTVGTEVTKVHMLQSAGQHQTNVNLNNALSSGVYFMQLKKEGQTTVVKFEVAN